MGKSEFNAVAQRCFNALHILKFTPTVIFIKKVWGWV